MDVVCCIRLADELDRKSVEVKYSVEVLKKTDYESFLQTERLLTHPAFQVLHFITLHSLGISAWQTKSRSRLPVMKHKECSFVTQEVGFE